MNQREWMEKHRPAWMSDDQFECYYFLAILFRGDHHIPGEVKPHGRGIKINAKSYGFATYDFDQLTRAVFLAHDMCVRLEINPSGPGMLKLCMWKRHLREGQMHERHPTIEGALESWRSNNPAKDQA